MWPSHAGGILVLDMPSGMILSSWITWLFHSVVCSVHEVLPNYARLVSRTQLYSIKYTHCISRASEFIPYVSWQEFNEEHWDAFIVCERYRDKRPATLDGPVWEFLHCITLLYDLNEFSISGYLHTLTTCSLAWCVMPEAYWAHYVPGIYHYCPLS